MNHYRYGATLRPFTQLNLRRLEACELSCRDHVAFNHGTMAFHRRLTDFEQSQLDLVPLGFEVASYCGDDHYAGWEAPTDEELDAQTRRADLRSGN